MTKRKLLSNPKVIGDLIQFFRVNKDEDYSSIEITDRTDEIFKDGHYHDIITFGTVRALIRFLRYHGVVVKVKKEGYNGNMGFWRYNPTHTYTHTV